METVSNAFANTYVFMNLSTRCLPVWIRTCSWSRVIRVISIELSVQKLI